LRLQFEFLTELWYSNMRAGELCGALTDNVFFAVNRECTARAGLFGEQFHPGPYVLKSHYRFRCGLARGSARQG